MGENNSSISVNYERETIELHREISSSTVVDLTNAISKFEEKEPLYDSFIFIVNNEGGPFFDALALYDLLRDFLRKRKMVSWVRGTAFSAAVVPFLAADERYMTDHSYFAFHCAYHEEIKRQPINRITLRPIYEMFETTDKESVVLMEERTKLSLEDANRLLETEALVGKKEAFKYGLITSLDNPFDLRKKISQRK